MKIHDLSRRSGVGLASLLASGLLLSGCMGTPTYGTGKPADEQLLEDITGVLSLAPKNDEQIRYEPRPELVTPASTEVLPPPQEEVSTASNPNWPESPEAKRARLRAEATANQDNAGYEPLIESDVAAAPQQAVRRTAGFDVPLDNTAIGSPKAQREEFNRRLAITKQGSPTQRRFLSEPPIDYRQPAQTAPSGDVGEDEWKKEKRLKAEARKAAGKSSWADILPW